MKRKSREEQIVDNVMQEQGMKSAASWDDLSYDAQIAYLHRHPGCDREITKKLGDMGQPVFQLNIDLCKAADFKSLILTDNYLE